MAVPRLRFREFIDKHNHEQLDGICAISSSKYNPIIGESCKCIELEHLAGNNEGLIGWTNSSEQKSIKNVFERGDVLFGKLRPYLRKTWLAEFSGVCTSEIWVMKGKSVLTEYLYYLIQTSKFNSIASVSSGSKMPRADWSYMSNYEFGIPTLSEQQKIAVFLTLLDRKIALQRRKIELLNDYIRGYVKFIFATYSTQVIKLKNICKYISSVNTLSCIENANKGVYPVYDAQGIVTRIDRFDMAEPYIAIIKDGAGVGRQQLCCAKTSFIGTMGALQPVGVELNYLYLVLNMIDFSKYITGSTIPHIYFKDYGNFEVPLPDENIQITQTATFMLLNAKKEHFEKQLVQLINLKKSLLQNLFI